MKKLLIVLSVLMLVACKKDEPVAVAMKWPNVPTDLMEACPDLKQVDTSTTKLSEVLPVIVDNYSEYYECKNKVDGWIEWYNTQKNINENVK